MKPLKHDGENDYTMTGQSFWVTVGYLQLYIVHQDDVLTVECMPHVNDDDAMDPPLASFSLMTKAE